MEAIIQRLIDNGDYDCPDCGHKAQEIERVVKVAEAAGALVGDIMASATDDNDLPLHFLSWTRLREALETCRKGEVAKQDLSQKLMDDRASMNGPIRRDTE